jgi:hypothetical protein
MHEGLAPGLFRRRPYLSSYAAEAAGLDRFLEVAGKANSGNHDPLLIEHSQLRRKSNRASWAPVKSASLCMNVVAAKKFQ